MPRLSYLPLAIFGLIAIAFLVGLSLNPSLVPSARVGSPAPAFDMDALYESLRRGHLGGAGLDVFNPEPPPLDHPILKLPNVICTPHIGAGSEEAQIGNSTIVAEKLINFFKP